MARAPRRFGALGSGRVLLRDRFEQLLNIDQLGRFDSRLLRGDRVVIGEQRGPRSADRIVGERRFVVIPRFEQHRGRLGRLVLSAKQLREPEPSQRRDRTAFERIGAEPRQLGLGPAKIVLLDEAVCPLEGGGGRCGAGRELLADSLERLASGLKLLVAGVRIGQLARDPLLAIAEFQQRVRRLRSRLGRIRPLGADKLVEQFLRFVERLQLAGHGQRIGVVGRKFAKHAVGQVIRAGGQFALEIGGGDLGEQLAGARQVARAILSKGPAVTGERCLGEFGELFEQDLVAVRRFRQPLLQFRVFGRGRSRGLGRVDRGGSQGGVLRGAEHH